MLLGCSDANLLLLLEDSGFLGCVWKRFSFLKLHVTPETVFLFFSTLFLSSSSFFAFTSSHKTACHEAHYCNTKKTICLPANGGCDESVLISSPSSVLFFCIWFASLSELCLYCRAPATRGLSCSWINFPSKGKQSRVACGTAWLASRCHSCCWGSSVISEQKCYGRGSIGVGSIQRRELEAGACSDLWWFAALVNDVFANGALAFCPLLAGGYQKVGDECRCSCRDVYLIKRGTRNHWMGSVW